MKNIAGLLEERQAIPMVKDQMPLLLEVQDDAWWQGVTLPTLEQVCKKRRLLVKLVEKKERKPLYTDFEDEMGEVATIELPGFTTADSFERFRAKARHFLKTYEDHLAVHKLANHHQSSDRARLHGCGTTL